MNEPTETRYAPAVYVGTLPGRRKPPGGSLLVVAAVFAVAAILLAAVVWPQLQTSLMVGALGVAGLFLATKRLYYFLAVFVVFMFFEGIIKNLFPHPFTFLLRDVFLGVIYLSWFIKYPLRNGFRGRYDKPISIAVGAFVFYTLIITIIPFTDEPLLYRLGGARMWLANIPLFFVGADEIRTRAQFDRFAYLFVACAAVTGIYGIVQYFVGFEHLIAVSQHYKVIINFSHLKRIAPPVAGLNRRIFSTFRLPKFLAEVALIASLLAVAYFVHAEQYKRRLFFAILVSLLFVVLSLTGCRSSYVPLVMGVVAYAILEPRRTLLAPIAIALGAGFAVMAWISRGVYVLRFATIFQGTTSLDRVISPLRAALRLVSDEPLGLGISASAKQSGFAVLTGVTECYIFIENTFGEALVSLGWPGAFLFLFLIVVVPFRLYRLAALNRGDNWRVNIVFAISLSFCFPALTGWAFYAGLGPVFYWLLAGAATSIYVRKG